ncbi:MAG: TlpA disulfide reductase family protein [Bacteroidota bacterium]
MNANYGWFLLGLALLLPGCGGSGKAEDEFLVRGTILNHPAGTVILEERSMSGIVPIDTTQIDEEGNFELRAPGKAETLFQLKFDPKKVIGFIPEFDEIQIDVDLEDLANYQVKGNVQTEMLRDFNVRQIRLFGEYLRNRRGMNLINRNVDLEKWRNQEARADKALMAFRDYLRIYADTTRFPLLSTLSATALDIGSNYFYMQRYLPRLKEKAGDVPYVQQLEQRVREVGKPFLRMRSDDVIGKNHRGEEIKLTDVRGKVVILYAWASYCEFSRQENARLHEILSAETDPQVVLFSISIDDDAEAWRQAVIEDQMPGPYHMLGDDGWDSQPFQFYDVPSIPTTYLLDYRGIIRSKNIRADDLEEHLDFIVQQYGEPQGAGS